MRHILVIAIIVLGLGSIASTLQQSDSEEGAVDSSEILINWHTGDREYKGRPFNGKAISFHPNGQKATIEKFSRGRRDGVLSRWFDTGLLAFESRYRMGKRGGRTSSWWSNGNLRSQTDYVDDQAHGFSWEWFRDGSKFKKYHYTLGKPTGLQQGWRTNGKLFSNFEYRNGRTYGLRKAKLCLPVEDETIVYN